MSRKFKGEIQANLTGQEDIGECSLFAFYLAQIINPDVRRIAQKLADVMIGDKQNGGDIGWFRGAVFQHETVIFQNKAFYEIFIKRRGFLFERLFPNISLGYRKPLALTTDRASAAVHRAQQD